MNMYNPRFEKEAFKKEVTNNVKTLFRRTVDEATPQQLFQAVSYAVKEVIIDDWLATQKKYDEDDPKMVYYMSMEFLMGRALGNNLINMTAYTEVKEALDEMGIDLNAIEDEEPDPALGNGGLGRLAACFLDSLATLGYAAYGCGIRYHYGMFKQKIEDGYQVEKPDNWLKDGNPFELRRPEYAKEVRFGGNIRVEYDEEGRTHFVQENYESVLAIPYDYPIVGYNNHVVNTLRIWDAEPIVDFQLDSFDRGDYHKAVEQQNLAKNIVEVLYPNDNHYAGKELRLKQQYFFISASIQAAIVKYKKKHDDITKLYEKVTFQMNDTHPTVAVAELMRILLDEEGLGWNEAWDITTKTCAYTNHTIMAEALEKWPIDLFSRLLPRIYQIIQEIDRRFVEQIRKTYPGDEGKVKRMAILMDGQVKMAHLAIVAGFSVNGVARLHTEILKKQEQIRKKKVEREQVKAAKESLLKEREGEKTKLEAQEKEKRTLVANLQKKQRGLQGEINKKRREANQLNARIDKLIAEEIERARKRAEEEARREAAARKKAEGKESQTAGTGTTVKTNSKPLETYTMSKADRELSGNFAANRGKLPMPISGAYIITSHYGQYAVEGLRNVKLDNKGIDIQGKPGAQARAIFDGKVAAVFQLNGLFNVLIRHGNYISVYCNLSSASVKSGDMVKTKQSIGQVFSDGTDNGRTVLHFQLRREKEKLNPEPWLNR